jgi:hypothetical protein
LKPGPRAQETPRRLVAEGRLEKVPASADLAGRLMDEARAHLLAADAVTGIDPSGSLQLAYDAARKAGSALLAVQGLRATSRGGHVAVQEATAVCDPSFAAFARLRRRRHESEYPSLAAPTLTAADAGEAIGQAAGLVRSAAACLESGRLGTFR